uniref:(northern house mosquito) hypothetical protein n=1 Tax=Culex pipiens TaxID=7175 RepID=A0A8D8EXU3_CULPI
MSSHSIVGHVLLLQVIHVTKKNHVLVIADGCQLDLLVPCWIRHYWRRHFFLVCAVLMPTTGVTTFVAAGSAAEEVEMLTVEAGCRTPGWASQLDSALVVIVHCSGLFWHNLDLSEYGLTPFFLKRINILISFVAVPSRWFSAIEKIR